VEDLCKELSREQIEELCQKLEEAEGEDDKRAAISEAIEAIYANRGDVRLVHLLFGLSHYLQIWAHICITMEAGQKRQHMNRKIREHPPGARRKQSPGPTQAQKASPQLTGTMASRSASAQIFCRNRSRTCRKRYASRKPKQQRRRRRAHSARRL
jgi:hypothetical protein